MNESRNSTIDEFEDKEYRESYAEDYLHSFIAMQFRAVREQRDMTQEELAQAIHTKQTAISRLESINNRSRNLNFLQKAAFALGCRLRVSLETFGSLINDEGPQFSREMLQRPSFEDEFAESNVAPKAEDASDSKSKVVDLIAHLANRLKSPSQLGARQSFGLDEMRGEVGRAPSIARTPAAGTTSDAKLSDYSPKAGGQETRIIGSSR